MPVGEFPAAVRATIIRRDVGVCQACGRVLFVELDLTPRLIAWDYSIQHRIPRGAGGRKAAHLHPLLVSEANGILLCGSATTGCHGRVEREREWARGRGFALSSFAKPETLLTTGWLDADGRERFPLQDP